MCAYDSISQTGTVEDYYEQFLLLLNTLELSSEHALSIFNSNLKGDIGKTVRLFYPQTLMHAFNLAKQIVAKVTVSLRDKRGMNGGEKVYVCGVV